MSRMSEGYNNVVGAVSLGDPWYREPSTTPTTMPATPDFDWNRFTSGLVDVYKLKVLAKINAQRAASGLDPLDPNSQAAANAVRAASPLAGLMGPALMLGVGAAVFFGGRALLRGRRRR